MNPKLDHKSNVSQNRSPAKPAISDTATQTKEIIFRFAAACARNVMLVADFTDWKKSPIKMTKGAGNIWHIKVSLPPGKYRYQFLVDIDLESNPMNGNILPLPFGTLHGVAEVAV